jgi:hypothetical protein
MCFSKNVGTGTGEYVLSYPSCRSDYLHHRAVTVYDRREDGEQTTVTRYCRAQKWRVPECLMPLD